MGRPGLSQIIPVLLGAAAGLAVTVGYFAPDVRESLFFQPQRARAEAAILHLAEREKEFRHRQGRFVAFGSTNMAALRPLAVEWQNWPSDTFQFDASATPQNGLRLRALPRAEAVQELRVGAQMFVAELAPSGSVRRSGWYP